MKLSVTIGEKGFFALHEQAQSIAIEVQFGGPQPNHFGVPTATAEAVEGGGFVGDTRRGGSCNVDQITLIPHCNGTHTECVGHIVDERQSLHSLLKDTLMPATVITVSPEIVGGQAEHYNPPADNGDLMITRTAIAAELENVPATQVQALVIRTLPNDFDKQSMQYDQFHYPPFLSNEALDYLNERGVEHLLVDFPSIDRMYDDGKLSNHHRFWQVSPGSKQLNPDSLTHKTITEMIYVPATLSDGLYLLNLQVAPLALDAAPSRPILIPLEANNDR